MHDDMWLLAHDVMADMTDDRQFVSFARTCVVAASRITRERVQTLLTNERELQIVDPRFFEELVAELLAADGWRDVHLVARLNAHGPDIIAAGRADDGDILIAECKRWSGAVGIDVVRTVMYWVEQEFDASQGLIATTSRFTRDAIDLRERRHRWRLDLTDGQLLKAWMQRNLHQLPAAATPTLISVLPRDAFVERVLTYRWPKQSGFVQLAHIDSPCQRCGGQLACGGANAGSTKARLRADFFHVCRSCRWSIDTNKDAYRSRKASARFAECPFCARNIADLL